LRLCFTSLAYPELNLAEVLERAARWGFDGVELRVADDGIHLRPETPIPSEAKALLERYRVPVPVLSGYLRASSLFTDKGGLAEKLGITLMRMAVDIGAIGVRIYGGQMSHKPREAARRIGEAIEGLRKRSGVGGVKMLLETHDDLAIIDNLRHLVEEYPLAEILYDPANIIYAGGSHDQAFKLIGERIAHVHIKDFRPEGGQRIFTPPGAGVVPIEKIIQDLRSSGYEGYVPIEWERYWHRDLPSGDLMIPKYRDYLRAII
jgi:sugar phosphate isomerase/epimerase